eukprot:TRINITY_DN2873_c0_g1_i3.p1 TRINITY_DN2873_c0_g1~~TRINITY_DN2873_c0_g1_i3.p1  ORF type:complete len:389 (-),score=76.82 TRINITY_DN2873_c0_g1_i3:435-1601(-)
MQNSPPKSPADHSTPVGRKRGPSRTEANSPQLQSMRFSLHRFKESSIQRISEIRSIYRVLPTCIPSGAELERMLLIPHAFLGREPIPFSFVSRDLINPQLSRSSVTFCAQAPQQPLPLGFKRTLATYPKTNSVLVASPLESSITLHSSSALQQIGTWPIDPPEQRVISTVRISIIAVNHEGTECAAYDLCAKQIRVFGRDGRLIVLLGPQGKVIHNPMDVETNHSSRAVNRFQHVVAIAFDSYDALYVADAHARAIYKFHPNGTLEWMLSDAHPSHNVLVGRISSLFVNDADEVVYLAYGGSKLKYLDSMGALTRVVAIDYTRGENYIGRGIEGGIVVSDTHANTIIFVSREGNIAHRIAVQEPHAAAFSRDGRLYAFVGVGQDLVAW